MSLRDRRFLVLCLFGVAACAQSDPEPPLTPASYTYPRDQTPRRVTKAKPAPAARRTALREQQQQSTPRDQKPPAPVVAGTEGDDSRTAITLARCQREVRCNHVGAEKEYVTEEDCIARLEPGTERELEASECPRSIAPPQLGACMEALRGEKCDRPRDLAHIKECSAAVLCQKQ